MAEGVSSVKETETSEEQNKTYLKTRLKTEGGWERENFWNYMSAACFKKPGATKRYAREIHKGTETRWKEL